MLLLLGQRSQLCTEGRAGLSRTVFLFRLSPVSNSVTIFARTRRIAVRHVDFRSSGFSGPCRQTENESTKSVQRYNSYKKVFIESRDSSPEGYRINSNTCVYETTTYYTVLGGVPDCERKVLLRSPA
eukprot:scaffold5787_cov157-Amphora_coffeaeformis.AAC.11